MLCGLMIVVCKIALIVSGENNIRIIGSHGNVATFATANFIAFRLRNACQGRAAWYTNGRVILLSAIDPIRELGICRNMVELTHGLVIFVRPTLPTVE